VSTHPLSEHARRPSRTTWLVLGLALVAALALAAGWVLVSRDSQPARPELQAVLDGLVSGPDAIAPGATAYVSGPRGTWVGAAGVADTGAGAPMPTDARFRLESVSKIFTAALIAQLDQDGRLSLDDTVERWLPGLLPYGKEITIRQLLTMQSGLIDNNDIVNASESAMRTYLARIEDAAQRERILAIAARLERDPASEFSPLWWIRFAAWQPLLFPPGSAMHYSNIGYEILGLIAARAGGQPLATLYRERLFEPLGLDATAYDPQGPIDGPHARGYGIAPDGRATDTTDWHAGIGAEGGIVSDAADTARFLTALMQGALLDRRHVNELEGDGLWLGGAPSGCAGQAFGWSGGGAGYKTDVWVDDGGTRVAVVLLNARQWDTAQATGDTASHAALVRLYCGA
jgi:D-alanyl-D-alanine carboxypeptidase